MYSIIQTLPWAWTWSSYQFTPWLSRLCPFGSTLYISYYVFVQLSTHRRVKLQLRCAAFFINFCIFYTILNVTLHIQLLQNSGYLPHVAESILELISYPTVGTSHSPTPKPPLRPLPTGNQPPVRSLDLWVCFFFISFTGLLYFSLDFTRKWYHARSFSLWFISLSMLPSKYIHINANGKMSFFYDWVVFHCTIYTTSLSIHPSVDA